MYANSVTVGLPRPIHLVSFDAATIGHDMQLLLYDLVLATDAALVNHLRTYPKLFTSMTVLSVVTAAFRDDLSGCNDLRQSVAGPYVPQFATRCRIGHDQRHHSCQVLPRTLSNYGRCRIR